MSEPWPKVSFIMPTLNAAALLENCLASIAKQTYPRDRYEIILADAMSQDATREIAARYGARIIDDHGRDMEQGKRLALQHATGEYIVFVDSDNEITHPAFGNPQPLTLAALHQTQRHVRVLEMFPRPRAFHVGAAKDKAIGRSRGGD